MKEDVGMPKPKKHANERLTYIVPKIKQNTSI